MLLNKMFNFSVSFLETKWSSISIAQLSQRPTWLSHARQVSSLLVNCILYNGFDSQSERTQSSPIQYSTWGYFFAGFELRIAISHLALFGSKKWATYWLFQWPGIGCGDLSMRISNMRMIPKKPIEHGPSSFLKWDMDCIQCLLWLLFGSLEHFLSHLKKFDTSLNT